MGVVVVFIVSQSKYSVGVVVIVIGRENIDEYGDRKN